MEVEAGLNIPVRGSEARKTLGILRKIVAVP
jgi:hypothetical protein